MIIGLTGSVGSGKTTVAALLEDLVGATVLDADAVVHRLQLPQAEGFKRIIAVFGGQFVLADGALDRKALADQVFSDPSELIKLNNALHPLVWDALRDELASLASLEWVVVMVPLLFETGMDALADVTLVVTIDEAIRTERLKERNRWSQTEIDQRLAAQMPDAEKIKRADFVIRNNGDVQSLRQELEILLPQVKQMAADKFRVHRGA